MFLQYVGWFYAEKSKSKKNDISWVFTEGITFFFFFFYNLVNNNNPVKLGVCLLLS